MTAIWDGCRSNTAAAVFWRIKKIRFQAQQNIKKYPKKISKKSISKNYFSGKIDTVLQKPKKSMRNCGVSG